VSEGIPKRSLGVAILVGTVLNLINQGDALLRDGHVDLLKAALTYAVPYCVATYGAVSYRLRLDDSRREGRNEWPRTRYAQIRGHHAAAACVRRGGRGYLLCGSTRVFLGLEMGRSTHSRKRLSGFHRTGLDLKSIRSSGSCPGLYTAHRGRPVLRG